MEPAALLRSELDAHNKVLAAVADAVAVEFAVLVDHCVAAVAADGKILLFGNGGSAADAQHIAAELVVRYKTDRAPVAAMALTTDSSVLSAAGNDLGFEHIFARQILALGRPGDVAIGISTSGNSANVIAGLRAAAAGRLVPAAFSAGDGGALAGIADPLLRVPAADTARIQEAHIFLGHTLCAALELRLGLA